MNTDIKTQMILDLETAIDYIINGKRTKVQINTNDYDVMVYTVKNVIRCDIKIKNGN